VLLASRSDNEHNALLDEGADKDAAKADSRRRAYVSRLPQPSTDFRSFGHCNRNLLERKIPE
jgi:hypothetical protein